MGKLVLFLADGATQDVPLDRERITIGRRADNDLCLPYPAVSGEHAQVVTILADSFLEDLGSTNGTLVNGKSIVKHFLTDHDQIDIGRQRLTYLSDNEARADPLPPDIARASMQGLFDKVAPARPLPQVEVPPAGRRPSTASRAGAEPAASPELAGARAALPSHSSWSPPHPSERAAASPAAQRSESAPPDGGALTSRLPAASALRLRDARAEPSAAAEATRVAPPVPATPAPPAPAALAPPAPAAPSGPSVRVLSGASSGRRVPFAGAELTIGRVGVQVAVVRKLEQGYRLVPLEGREPPRINGAPVAPEGAALHPGDTFEVAGVRLELSADA